MFRIAIFREPMKNTKVSSVIPMCNTKCDTYGGLWADKGVYRIAKETQLVKPDKSGNISLGGFHMERYCWPVLVHTWNLQECLQL